jgi:hypothetical protein
MQLDERGAAVMERRLLTTGVFSSVKITIEPDETLHVDVAEKWTTIPIARAAYGGGTPLRVIGFYDSHSFGRLITVGAETRKYGVSPPGAVAYVKAPRFDGGRYVLGSEVWREFRERTLYDHDGKVLGVTSASDTLGRLKLLRSTDPDDPIKLGVNIEALQERPAAQVAGADLPIQTRTSRQLALMPTAQYDDVIVDPIVFDGTRVITRYGAVYSNGSRKTYGKGEVEAFTYHVLPHQINLAGHAVAGASALDTVYNEYFLGGLDSIRGFPDGIVHGTHALWANAELRYTPDSLRFKYLYVQTLGFVDGGGAGPRFDKALDNSHASAGGGLRFSVPQVYRMILRVDYAAAIDGSAKHGISAGFNHFFDPYKPL